MRKFLGLACLAALLATGCRDSTASGAADSVAGGSVTNYDARGVVVRVEPGGQSVVVRHEAITNYMGAMTMPFRVKDKRLLAGLAPGNLIAFRLAVTATDGWIESLRILETNAPEPVRPTMRVVRDVAPLLVGDLLPDYHFTNELGQAVSLASYRGQAIALTFFFTSCPYPTFCPKMCANFQGAAKSLAGDPEAPSQWHLFALTIDPETDSPQVLKSYAGRYERDPARWSFLTGDLIDVTAIGEQFGLQFWREAGNLNHNLRTIVVDPQGRVSKIIPSNEWDSPALVAALKAAAKSPAK
jgi:protein SCO1/2